MKIDLSKIPENPGCYIYLDESKKIIYVGKAKNLKKRVTSYFKNKNLDTKTKSLVKNIKDIDFIVTDSEIEALILENSLIKKNKPKYNIDLKDSKGYAFIEMTNEKYPRLIVARKKEKDGGKYFGPFTSAQSRDYVLQVINKIFKLRTCKKLPKRKCIRYDIGICSAPCINKIFHEEYMEDLHLAELALKGKTKDIEKKLTSQMNKYAKSQEFEKALIAREKINSIDYLSKKQNIQREKKYDEDIINYVKDDGKIYLMLFNIHNGLLENKKEFVFDFYEEAINQFLVQYYSENPIPKKIIVPSILDESIIGFLSQKNKSKVEVVIPQKGELKELLDLVEKNIRIQYFKGIESLNCLKKELNMEELPNVIECFDISHLGGTEVVASMVQFRGGIPDKTNYRKFKIRGGDKNDDFAAMNEVVKRRYSRLKNEEKPLPDLIVVDGGLGQLNSSIKSLEEIGIKVPIISLAKKFEEIYIPKKEVPLLLSPKNKARLLLQSIRDEAHRFAVKYQRERRSKKIFKKS